MVAGNGDKADASKTNLDTIIVTLDTNMPSSVSANAAALENVTYTPSVEIENNVFREMPVRGILVTTRKPVVIRNNEFDNVAGAAVYISDDVNSWYESGHDEDVLIEGNVFRRCGVNQNSYSAFIQFDPTNNGAAEPVHKNVRIKDNTFYFTNGTGNIINAKSVNGLTFTGNKVLRFSVNEKANPAKTTLAIGESVAMNVSAVEGANINAFTFNGCRNVNISDNIYDKGVTRRVNITNMQNSEVKIGENEGVSIGSGTQPASEMIYVSSDPEVVRVDGTGHVTGLKKGTATVTAYELVGGRKFQADPVTFTVTDQSTGTVTAVKVLAKDLTVKNPSDGGYSVSGDSVTIKAMGQGLWATQTANNVIVSGENVNRGDGTFTAIVKMSGKTVNNWDEAGLFIYKDDDNYVAVERKHGTNSPKVHVVTEANGSANEDQNTENPNAEAIWLKLEKSGNTFTGYCSADKENWTKVGNSITNDKIGNSFGVALVAGTGNSTKGTAFTFSDLEINGKAVALTEDAATGGESGNIENLAKVKSGNAILESASVSGVSFPTFSSETKSYVTTADKSVKSVKISLKAKDENAKIEICRNGVGNAVGLKNVNEIVSAENGKNQITDQEVALVAGLNIITARVIAEDGTTQEIYRFLEQNPEASVKGGRQNLALIREQDTRNAQVIMANCIDSSIDGILMSQTVVKIALKNLGEGAKAVLNVNGKTYNPQESIPVSGDNMTVGIAITPDGGVTEHYSLSLRVPSDSNAKLEKVQFGSTIQSNGNFNANLKEYTASTMTRTSRVTFTAQEANAKITVKCNNVTAVTGTGSVETSVTMKKGNNQLQVTVESADKSRTETYIWRVEGKSEVYLSDLSYESNSATGWGSIMKDKSVDGNTLTLYDGSQEKTFEKGMGIHATANLYYNIEGMGFKKFTSYMGVDREANQDGNVKFNVYTDNKQVYTGEAVTRASEMAKLDISVEGVKILRLNVDQNGSDSNDHADFADAKFITELADDTTPETVAVTGVTLDKSTAKLTEKGQTVELTATVAPENATNKNVIFETSDEKVATVDGNGKVSAVANGKATITVTTEDGEKTAACEVTVEIPNVPVPAPEELVNEVKNEIAAAEGRKESDYTEETWKVYEKALNAAKEAVEQKTATEEEMQQILTALRNAASALKKETPSTEKETPSTNPQTPETPNDGTVKVGQVIKAEGQYGVFTYKVTGKDTVEVKSITAKGKAKKSVKIFDKIKASGKTWKVTGVAANALKGNKKMESLTIGKNVKKIGKNAFANCRKLKKVTVKSKKINTIGKNAFKNINKKATVKVPKAQKKKYAKLLNKAKLSKKVKIK